ncbi:MAG: two-component regulator propeller domain-containing protein [Chitinophagaceae bacterium]
MLKFTPALLHNHFSKKGFPFACNFYKQIAQSLLTGLAGGLKKKQCFIIGLFILLKGPLSLNAQEYNYINYSIKDGLPSNTIYSICQDTDGFLWFATDAGVVRFNGLQFKTFTSADGLPDNEILNVYADKQGRVWITPFKNKLCYYKNGKIYNEKNDTIIRQIELLSFVTNIVEDDFGNLLLFDNTNIYKISEKNKVVLLPMHHLIGARKNKHHPGFFFIKKDSAFNYDLNTITLKGIDPKYEFPGDLLELDLDSTDKSITIPKPVGTIQATKESMRLHFISTVHGSYQIAKDKAVFEEHYLPDEKVTSTFQDDEKNIWFAVSGKGLMKLASSSIHNYAPSKTPSQREIYIVSGFKKKIVAGSDDSRLYLFSLPEQKFTSINLERLGIKARYNGGVSRAFCAQVLSSGDCLIGFDDFLAKLSIDDRVSIKDIHPIKGIAEYGSKELAIATGRGIFRLRKDDLSIIDTLYQQRATAVCFSNNCLYFGTLSGLYEIDANKKITFWGENQRQLSTRISAIEEDQNGVLWIATYNEGIVGLKNNKVIYEINTGNALPSNNCRSIYADKKLLWVGTNKGVCKINIDSPTNSSISFQQSQGLPTDMVNSIFADDSLVYAGTPAGLTVFPRNLSLQQPNYRLKLLGVTIDDSTQLSENNHYSAGYGKRVRIDYSLISFRSNDIRSYVYRINGVSQKWDTTTNASIELSYLPPGDFSLEIKAINNKKEIASNPIKIFLTVDTPFWKSKWFILAAGMAIFSLGWLGIYVLLKRKGQIEKRKKDIQLEMLELQQKALRAQMNPHFIFNCLNTVQDFVLTQDIEPANRFLVNLSSLIRQTLENSNNSFISIADEIRYLTTYLELEKTRFDNRFNFSFLIGEKLKPKMDQLKIPTMITQPYIENAIKHGISHAKDGLGLITIETDLIAHEKLIFVITDNGMGINKTKAETPNRNHQSKGMSLTAERVQTMTQITGKKIWVNVKDEQEEDNTIVSGTRVEIVFEL